MALALEAAGDDTVIKNHRLRKIKLFHCLLNYIKVSSRTYRMLMRHFSNDGPAAYQAVLIIGNLRVPARIVRAREDSWNQMEYDKLRLPYSCDGFFMWADAVLEQGEILGKDGEARLNVRLSIFVRKSGPEADP